MQDSSAFDHIVRLFGLSKSQNVGGREANILDAKPLRHAGTIGEARRAQIDGMHPRLRTIGDGGVHRLPAGPGAGNQHVAGCFQALGFRVAEIIGQKSARRAGLRYLQAEPTWVGRRAILIGDAL